jgi:hypothetical protein
VGAVIGGAVLVAIGMGLILLGLINHVGVAIAPGSLCLLVGGAVLGNGLARRNVRLLPGSQIVKAPPNQT